MDAWLSLGPAARLVGVGPDTLRRWADVGRVEAFVTPGGHRRLSRRALERMVLGVVFLFLGFLTSIEVFRQIRVPSTSVVLRTRTTQE